MIVTVEALNFRCLRYIKQDLDLFHVLVGPNASGKTTFCDVIRFLGELVSDGLEAAIRGRTENLRDLIWQHKGNRFELAIEMAILKNHRNIHGLRPQRRMKIGLDQGESFVEFCNKGWRMGS